MNVKFKIKIPYYFTLTELQLYKIEDLKPFEFLILNLLYSCHKNEIEKDKPLISAINEYYGINNDIATWFSSIFKKMKANNSISYDIDISEKNIINKNIMLGDFKINDEIIKLLDRKIFKAFNNKNERKELLYCFVPYWDNEGFPSYIYRKKDKILKDISDEENNYLENKNFNIRKTIESCSYNFFMNELTSLGEYRCANILIKEDIKKKICYEEVEFYVLNDSFFYPSNEFTIKCNKKFFDNEIIDFEFSFKNEYCLSSIMKNDYSLLTENIQSKYVVFKDVKNVLDINKNLNNIFPNNNYSVYDDRIIKIYKKNYEAKFKYEENEKTINIIRLSYIEENDSDFLKYIDNLITNSILTSYCKNEIINDKIDQVINEHLIKNNKNIDKKIIEEFKNRNINNLDTLNIKLDTIFNYANNDINDKLLQLAFNQDLSRQRLHELQEIELDKYFPQNISELLEKILSIYKINYNDNQPIFNISIEKEFLNIKSDYELLSYDEDDIGANIDKLKDWKNKYKDNLFFNKFLKNKIENKIYELDSSIINRNKGEIESIAINIRKIIEEHCYNWKKNDNDKNSYDYLNFLQVQKLITIDECKEMKRIKNQSDVQLHYKKEWSSMDYKKSQEILSIQKQNLEKVKDIFSKIDK